MSDKSKSPEKKRGETAEPTKNGDKLTPKKEEEKKSSNNKLLLMVMGVMVAYNLYLF